MALRIGHLALAAMLLSLAGCAMCANPFDCYYAAYGGRLPRTDMVHGRVGSILDAAGGGVVTTQEIMQPGEIQDADALGGEVSQESSDQEGPEAGEAAPATDEPFSESPDTLGLESIPAPGTDEFDRAFEAIQDELSDTPVELDE